MSKVKGHITVFPADGSPTFERDTHQCVHCQAHFMVEPGSGTKRGFCMRCSGPTCGREKCDACVPFEKWLDYVEKGIDPANAPVKIIVPENFSCR